MALKKGEASIFNLRHAVVANRYKPVYPTKYSYEAGKGEEEEEEEKEEEKYGGGNGACKGRSKFVSSTK